MCAVCGGSADHRRAGEIRIRCRRGFESSTGNVCSANVQVGAKPMMPRGVGAVDFRVKALCRPVVIRLAPFPIPATASSCYLTPPASTPKIEEFNTHRLEILHIAVTTARDGSRPRHYECRARAGGPRPGCREVAAVALGPVHHGPTPPGSIECIQWRSSPPLSRGS